jgi:hypothetical protein
MPDFAGVQWQPINQLPMFRQMIDGMTAEVQDFLNTLTEAQHKPQSLDDDTLNRVEKQYRERLHFLSIYDEQFRRWQMQHLTPQQARTVDGFAYEVAATRPLVAQVLALAAELREQSIDRIRELSDEELGLMTLLGLSPAEFQRLKREGEGH